MSNQERKVDGEFSGIGEPEELGNINTYVEIIQNVPDPR